MFFSSESAAAVLFVPPSVDEAGPSVTSPNMSASSSASLLWGSVSADAMVRLQRFACFYLCLWVS